MATKVAWTTMDRTTVQGLLVFLFPPGFETTISSNMVPTSYRPEQGDLRPPHRSGVCCRLRVRFLSQLPAGREIDATRPRAAQRCQNWSTFLPQSPPPEQRRKREEPGLP